MLKEDSKLTRDVIGVMPGLGELRNRLAGEDVDEGKQVLIVIEHSVEVLADSILGTVKMLEHFLILCD